MKFSLFYEIPVANPSAPQAEYRAYQNTLEQALFGEKMGFHAFWTVEHHFLKHFSHCSNPEVLYGAIAARTERIRLGYGVRLMPKPYNHPIRSAESAAVLDLISSGRVDFGTGRSATRAEEGLADSLLAELALMKDARRALRAKDLPKALRLLERHEREFPDSQFETERASSMASARCQLGRGPNGEGTGGVACP